MHAGDPASNSINTLDIEEYVAFPQNNILGSKKMQIYQSFIPHHL